MIEIRLPALDQSGQQSIEEVLPAEPLGGGRFRLLASPGLVEGVAAGDEVELAPADRTGYRVLRRGGNLCVWIYVPEPPLEETDARLSLAAVMLGGYLDGGKHRASDSHCPGRRRISASRSGAGSGSR
jgi:hypothetical protein